MASLNNDPVSNISNKFVESLSKIIVSVLPFFLFGISAENTMLFSLVWVQTSQVILASLTNIIQFLVDYLKNRRVKDIVTVKLFEKYENGLYENGFQYNHYVYLSWFFSNHLKVEKVSSFYVDHKSLYQIDDNNMLRFEWKNNSFFAKFESLKEEKSSTVRKIILSSRNLDDIKNFLEEISVLYYDWAHEERLKKTKRECWKFENVWQGSTIRLIKKPECYFIRDDVKQFLLRDVETFLKSETRYTELSIPYKRGYILYGPPGCGKTSFQYVVSNVFKKDIYKICAKDLKQKVFQYMIRQLGTDKVITIDDADRLSSFQEEKGVDAKDDEGYIDLKTLLDVFDGYEYLYGCIIIISCNDISKLPPALMRSGRFDIKQVIDFPSLDCIVKMLKYVFGESYLERIEEWADNLKLPRFESVNVCTAEVLNTYILANREDFEMAIDQLTKRLNQTI